MIHLKENPIGIDHEIQRIQQNLYDKLDFKNIEAFGRVYLIEKNDKTIPAYFEKGNDYKEIILNNYDAVFFFIESEKSEAVNSHQLETVVDIIFLLDLSKIKPNIQHRADEEVRIEIKEIIKKHRSFGLSEIVKGKEAIKGFDSNLIDMQPYHLLKFSGSLRYSTKIC